MSAQQTQAVEKCWWWKRQTYQLHYILWRLLPQLGICLGGIGCWWWSSEIFIPIIHHVHGIASNCCFSKHNMSHLLFHVGSSNILFLFGMQGFKETFSYLESMVSKTAREISSIMTWLVLSSTPICKLVKLTFILSWSSK